MKKAFKKAISVLLVAVMMLGTAPLAGFIGLELPDIFEVKAEAATDGYYTYSVSNGEATITDVSTSISGDIVIPSTLGGYPVTTIGIQAFFYCKNVEGITIPDSVTRIGSDAFEDTAYYNDASNWENDVLYIGNHLIEAKGSLSGSYKIKDGTLTIADFAFYYSPSLTSITIPDSVTSIGGSTFENCDKLESVTIGNGVTSIGGYAFRDCNNLKNVIFGSGVKNIGTYAFTCCTSLESIILPDGLISIGKWAFMYCSNLTDITIPDSVTSIGVQAFDKCSNIKNVYYGGSKAEWKKLWNEEGKNLPASEKIHYNSTGPDGGTTKNPDNIPDYDSSVVDSSTVKTPTETIINYGDSIVLHIDPSKIPEGGYVEWYASNENFTYSVSSFGTTCTISPSKSGDTTFTAIVYDAQGNIVSADNQEMTSKAGFFDKFIAFFKKLFGLTKTIPEALKVTKKAGNISLS